LKGDVLHREKDDKAGCENKEKNKEKGKFIQGKILVKIGVIFVPELTTYKTTNNNEKERYIGQIIFVFFPYEDFKDQNEKRSEDQDQKRRQGKEAI